MLSNDVLANIRSRRSIRTYLAKQIEDEKLDLVLEAGTYAPTGRGAQSPAMNARVMGTDSDPYYGAPTVVLVFADASRNTCVEDGSCVLENMMLAAHALGLGSCWVHRERQMFEMEQGRVLMKQWGLSEHLIGVGAIALGYPAGEMPQAAKRKDGYLVKV